MCFESRLNPGSINLCCVTFVPDYEERAKALVAFTLLIAWQAGAGRLVNDGKAVYFIVDKGGWLCYLHMEICSFCEVYEVLLVHFIINRRLQFSRLVFP